MVRKQEGITLMSFVMVLIVVGFFALMAMKLVPMYTEFHNMKSAVDEFAAQPDSATKTPAQAWADLERDLALLPFCGLPPYTADRLIDVTILVHPPSLLASSCAATSRCSGSILPPP